MSDGDVLITGSADGATLRVTWRGLVSAVVATVTAIVGGMIIAGDFRYAPKQETREQIVQLKAEHKQHDVEQVRVATQMARIEEKIDELNRFLRSRTAQTHQ